MRKEILHIVNIPWHSGLAKYAIDMAEQMQYCGEKIIFAVTGNSVLYKEVSSSFVTVQLYGRGIPGSILSFFKIFKYRNRLKSIIVHTGSSFFIGFLLSRIIGVPVYRIRAEKSPIKRNFFNLIMHKKADGIIIPTEAIREDIIRFGVRKDKVFKVSPMVDINVFDDVPIPDNRNIGFIGRLDPVKGHRELLRSLEKLKQKTNDFKLIIAGEEVNIKWEELKELADDLNILDNIEYRGCLSNADLLATMKQCRFGVVPSVGSEAVSRITLEWMSVGRPVIASSVGSLPELIQDNRTGFLSTPGDIDALSENMLKLINNNDLNRTMGLAARNYIEENHSPKKFREALFILF